MPKVLLFADLHAHNWREFSMPIEYRGMLLGSRLVDALKFLDVVKKAVGKHSIDACVFAGDLFHRKRFIDVTVYNAVAEALWRLSRRCPIYLLPGNHDLASELEHAISPFRRYRSIIVVDKPQVIPELGYAGLIPYTDSRDVFLNSFMPLRENGVRWIVSHIGISGAVAGKTLFKPPEEVQLSDIPKDLPFYSGHYHRPQKLRSTPPVVYIGAPLEIDRGDGLAARGYVVLDTDSPDTCKRYVYVGPSFIRREAQDFDETIRGMFVDAIHYGTETSAEIVERGLALGARGINVIPSVKRTVSQSKLRQLKKSSGELPSLEEVCDIYVDHVAVNLDNDKLKALGRESIFRRLTMLLDWLEISNFLSFAEEQKLQLADRGLVLIEGENQDDPVSTSNGSGKSAILEAVVWALYGKTLRGLTGDDVIRRSASSCSVTVGGRSPSGEWSIRRFRGSKKGLEFILDGQRYGDINNQAGTQEKINAFFGADYEIFTNAVVFGQGDKWHFTELSDAQRKSLFDRLIGVEQLGEAKRLAKAKYDALGAESVQLMVSIDGVKSSIRAEESAVEVMRRAHIQAVEDKLYSIKSDIKDLGLEPKVLGNLASKRAEISSQEKLAKMLAREKGRLEALRDVAVDKKSKLEAKLFVVEEQLKAAKKLESTCPTCGSILDARAIRDRVRSLRARADKLTRVISTLPDIGPDYRKASVAHNQALCDASSGRIELERLSAAVEKRAEYRQRLTALESKLAKVRAELSKAKKEKASSIEIKRALSNIKVYAKKLETLERLLEKLDVERQYHSFWVDAFGDAGLKNYLIEDVAPKLNRRAAEYSQHLMGGLVVELSPYRRLKSGQLRDKFEVIVKNEWGANSYSGSSGGEKRKIDIVVARTLQSLGAGKLQCNISWWDEVFESLDESSCEAVMRSLIAEAETKSSVFVVTHLDWLKPYFNRVVKVIKQSGVSRIEG